MAVRRVYQLPAGILRVPALSMPVATEESLALASDLIDTMRASPACVGLAAPQIGVGVRAFVMDVTGHKKARSCHGLVVLFDPIVEQEESPATAREGCMSVPELTGDVTRATRLLVRGTSPEGDDRVLEVDAFEARAVQHEVDHLNGLLFLDRVAASGGVFPRKVYR